MSDDKTTSTAPDVAQDTTALSRIADLAAQLLRASSAHVSLVSDGVPADVGSLCAVTGAAAEAVVVRDARADERVVGLPAVRRGEVGAYLGVPLLVRGEPVGALCVHAAAPRAWTEADVQLLQQLAVPVVAELQLAVLTEDYENDRVVWQLAVDAAGVGAFDWNLQTGELRWDDRLLELFGLDHATFGGTIEAFNAGVHPDDLPRVSEALDHAIRTIGVYAAEYRVLLPGGGVRWVAARGRALAGVDGTAARVLGAAFDTTAARDSEARVARVLEAMPSAFFSLDPQWRFTYVNSEGRRLLGGIGSELLGEVIWELFPDAVGSAFETHYRHAVESGEPVEFEAYYPPPLDRWYEVRAWPSPDALSVYFFDITDRRRAEEVLARAADRRAVLARLSEALSGSLDLEQGVVELAQAVVGPWADWCLVTLVDPSVLGPGTAADPPASWRHGLRDAAAWHADPAARDLVERYRELRVDALTDESLLVAAVREDRPVVLSTEAAEAIAGVLEPGEARDLCLELAPAAAAVLPLRGRERTIGVLSAFRGPERGAFTADDLADLADAAGRAGPALDNARLYAEQRDLAMVLQRSLLTAPPEPDHLRLAVRYEPSAQAAQVGGDWYDAFLQPDGATSVVIGDVVGHDTAAAAAMGQLRGLLRGVAVTTGEGPAAVLTRVDQAMETLQLHTTATVVVARFEQTPAERDAGTTRLRWSNAGHPPPLVVTRPGPGRVEVATLEPERFELLLGIDPAFARTESTVTLPPGATVLLYTDGLVERRGHAIDEGIDTLRATLAELADLDLSLDELCERLLARLLPDRPEDDVALVAVRTDGA